MQIAVVTLFPEMFAAVGEYGVTGRAITNNLVSLHCLNPRDYTQDKHRTVDDKPFGGGPGMLMKTGPLQAAIGAARQAVGSASLTDKAGKEAHSKGGNSAKGGKSTPRVVYLSPQGRRLDQQGVVELADLDKLVLVCGRYQGIDERVLETEIDEEWSIGDYVISGGELAAMVLIDAVTRLQSGALGAEECASLDTFAEGLLHCPQYTRPQEVGGLEVPPTLLSGDHEQIRRWRLKNSLGTTWRKRPDLLLDSKLDEEHRELLQEYIEEYQGRGPQSRNR